MKAKFTPCFVAFATISLAIAAPALSQNAPAVKDPKCAAPPIQQNSQENKTGIDPNATGSTDLSDCKGVITPPATQDQGLVQPAPSTGNTPVLRPGDVPSQAPKSK
jgi:hypothetical protein